MKSVKMFTNYEDCENWMDAHDNSCEYPIMVDDGWRFAADFETECKSYKTALRRFAKTFESSKIVMDWIPFMEEAAESDYFEQTDGCENGKFAWYIEEVDDGVWYISLVVSGEYRGDGVTEKPAAAVETSDAVEASEAADTFEADSEITSEVAGAQDAIRIVKNAITARDAEAKGEMKPYFKFQTNGELAILNGIQVNLNLYSPDFCLMQGYDLNSYSFSRSGAEMVISYLVKMYQLVAIFRHLRSRMY